MLTGDHQQVILPDLNAGCSMADMADIDQVEEAWDELAQVIDVDRLIPVTYMNSSAALKAFVGRHGGAVCTSSNARAVLTLGARTRRHASSSSPTSTSAGTPATSWATGRRHARLEPAPGPGRPHRRRGEGIDAAVVEGPLLGAPALPARTRRRLPRRAPRRDRDGPPGVRPRRRGAGRRHRLDRRHHPGRRRRPRRLGHRRRHRDPSREPARQRVARQDRRVPRPARVPVLDDVAHRPAAPGLDPRGPRRAARCATGSWSTPTLPSGPRSRSSGCSPSPKRVPAVHARTASISPPRR